MNSAARYLKLICPAAFYPVAFYLAVMLLLMSCASTTSIIDNTSVTGVQADKATQATKNEPEESASNLSEISVSSDQQYVSKKTQAPQLPNLDLDAHSLENLLLSYLSLQQGDLNLAADSALSVASSSRDHRIARLATSIALGKRDYSLVNQAASLWLELAPENQEAQTSLVISQIALNQIDGAVSSITRFQGDSGVDEMIRYVAGVVVRQTNSLAALAIMQHFTKAYPASAQVMLSSAYVAERFEKPLLANQWSDRALELNPGWDLAAQLKVGLLQRQGLVAERADFIKQFVSDFPDSISMRIQHAVGLAGQERYQEGLDAIQAVLADDPQNVSALSYAAALAEQVNDVPLAKKYYAKALRNDKSNDEVRWALARIAATEKKYLRAENFFAEITDDRYYFRAQIQVANMRFHTQNVESAINTLSLIEVNSEAEFLDVALNRHFLLMTAHEYQQALGYINESIVYLPNNNDLRYSRALVAAELQNIQLVESDLRIVINSDPSHADALNALGYTLADQTDRLDEARALIEKALKLRPTDAHILDSMGWVAYRQNDFATAIKFLRKAYQASPQAEIAAHLGEVYWETGDQDSARQIWLEGLEIDQNNRVLNETVERYGVSFDLLPAV